MGGGRDGKQREATDLVTLRAGTHSQRRDKLGKQGEATGSNMVEPWWTLATLGVP